MRKVETVGSGSGTRRAFFVSDGGFSTAGMALALLLSLSLVFSAAQVYRVQSACADVQHVADAAALAAQNQVAAFYTVATTCDAVVLSLSLTGVACTGVGVVALCVPAAQGAGEKLIEAGKRIFEARDTFSEQVTRGLGNLQKLLPVIAAAQAAATASANGNNTVGYVGLAMLVPFEGAPLNVPVLECQDETLAEVEAQAPGIEQAARDAERAAAEADGHKMRAYLADCGSQDGYCMYERSATLAGMHGSANPWYSSVDMWSFGVALERARTYYARRLAQEAPLSPSVHEQAASALRTHFYAYACDQVAQGYVHETQDSFDAHFPLLPRNTTQMRETALYTQVAYPVTEDEEGVRTMHAYDGCPLASEGRIGWGSIEQMETEDMPTCSECEFAASKMGKVAQASTSIQNGFEYHYLIVAQEAELYQKARDELAERGRAVKDPVQSIMDKLKELASQAQRARIVVDPPGSTGAVAVVVGSSGASASELVPSSFVADSGMLGTTMAIAGAALAEDDATEEANALTSLFDGLAERVPIAGGLPQLAVQVWGTLLGAYGRGFEGMIQAVEQALGALPLLGRTGFGSWAAGTLKDMLVGAGLEPVELSSRKPVLVNTYRVASADDGMFSQALVRAKQLHAGSAGPLASNPLGMAVAAAGGVATERLDGLEEGIVIARIGFFGSDGPGVDIRIALPPSVRDASHGLVDQAVQSVQSLGASGSSGSGRWR